MKLDPLSCGGYTSIQCSVSLSARSQVTIIYGCLSLHVFVSGVCLSCSGLGSLCIVSEGSLGHKLAGVLAQMAKQEFASQAEGDTGGQAAEVLAEIVVPSLMEVADQVQLYTPV